MEQNYDQAAAVNTSKLQPNQIIRYAIIGVIALVALSLVISIVAALLPGKFESRDANNIDWAVNDDGEMVFVFNGKKLVEVSDDITEEIGKSNYGYYYGISTDYNREYAVIKTEGKETKDGKYKDGDLYVVNSKKCQKVADEVSDYTMSAFGSTLIYISDGDLFVVELSKPTKAKKIDSDIDGISAVSPDGKTFAYYTVEEKESEEEGTTFEYDYFVSKGNKKGEKFAKKDSEIVALSNGAKYVYYVKGDKVFVNDSKLADEKDMSDYYSLNRDGSQMIYSAKNSKGEYKTYIVSKAGEKVAIGDGQYSDILATTGTYRSNCYNVASFAKCAVRVNDGDDTVYYFLKNLKSEGTKISALKNASQVQLLEDGTTALFIKKGDLRSVNITKPTSEPKTYTGFEEDVSYFDASNDGKFIYVADTDATMYFVKSAKKAVKIAEDINNGFIVMNNGAAYFMNDDEELCYIKKTSKAKVVTDDLDNVADYDVVSGVMTIVSDDQYGNVNGAKFKKLFDIETKKANADE